MLPTPAAVWYWKNRKSELEKILSNPQNSPPLLLLSLYLLAYTIKAVGMSVCCCRRACAKECSQGQGSGSNFCEQLQLQHLAILGRENCDFDDYFSFTAEKAL
eukprot:443270-Pelagomonas_calceolata.AAC.2